MPRWLLLVATIASIHGAAEPFPTPPEQTDEQISLMDFLWLFEAGNQGIARRRGELIDVTAFMEKKREKKRDRLQKINLS